MSSSIIEVATQPFNDQKPGTSGLRKKVDVFSKSGYTQNFIQSILEATKPKSLVVGGDGRYYSEDCIKIIISMCAANGVERLFIAKNGILSTPAASCLIRSLKTDGGIILTASHNPGGKDGDFGIKYNVSNGGSAPESITNKIYEISRTLTCYKSLLKRPQIDLSEVGTFMAGSMTVDVVDPMDDYVKLLKQVFNFEMIKDGMMKMKLKILVDCMHGVMGPFAKRILIDELGFPGESVINAVPKEDFGEGHPDPNLEHAKELIERLKKDPTIGVGCAFDGDGDRNMILGSEAYFVSPGDSLAILAFNYNHIKCFQGEDYKPTGFARSFPTSPAIDRVAAHHEVNLYETPTGWKFFCNLLDADKVIMCGEESFGTGSNHVREKDGIWALLAWLSILTSIRNYTIRDICKDHWDLFGRDYFRRYDYEELDADKCKQFMSQLETLLTGYSFVGKEFEGKSQKFKVKESGNFKYTDPIDNSVATNQGLYIKFENDDRVIFRLSGTGSSGGTVRIYFNKLEVEEIFEDPSKILGDLIEVALELSKFKQIFGDIKPTVIT